MKAKTIDEVCGKPEGTFKKQIEAQKKFLASVEADRKERIRNRNKNNLIELK